MINSLTIEDEDKRQYLMELHDRIEETKMRVEIAKAERARYKKYGSGGDDDDWFDMGGTPNTIYYYLKRHGSLDFDKLEELQKKIEEIRKRVAVARALRAQRAQHPQPSSEMEEEEDVWTDDY